MKHTHTHTQCMHKSIVLCFIIIIIMCKSHSLSLSRSLARSPTHSLTCSLTHSLTPSLTHLLTPSLAHSHFLPRSLTLSLAHSWLQEEEAQAKALDLLLHKKHVREPPKTLEGKHSRPETIYDDDFIVLPKLEEHQSSELSPLGRRRTSAITTGDTPSPQSIRKRVTSTTSTTLTTSPLHPSPGSSPNHSPTREKRGRCRSPRLLPETPTGKGQGSLLERQAVNGKRRHSGPTIQSV